MDRMWIITAVVLAFAITSNFGVWLLPIQIGRAHV